MFDRAEIKLRSKELMKTQYWCGVLTCLICMLINGISFSGSFSWNAGAVYFNVSYGNLISLLIGTVLIVGECHVFTRIIRAEPARTGDMFNRAFSGYLRNLGGMLWMGLLTILWTLLFIVPGIYKSMRYFCTPYILAEYPHVRATDALAISNRVTQGHAGEIFVFMLSFIGWSLLSAFTFGILEVFYVAPYRAASCAALSSELMRNALENGIISPDELGIA